MRKAVYRLETTRLVLRCFGPDDAAAVKQAEDESRLHLSAFMLWAASGPQSLDEVVAKLRGFRARFDTDADYMYGAFDRATGTMVGGCGLHPRVGAGGIEIGYWVHPSWTRRGIATEMAGALTRAAFEVGGLRFLEIRCASTNTTSARVPTKLGLTHEATLRKRIELPGGTFDDAHVFALLAEDYPASPAKTVPVAAFDGTNQKLL